MPFETFVYGCLDIVINAYKFHSGKLIVSSKYDSYQADIMVESMDNFPQDYGVEVDIQPLDHNE